MLSKCEAQGQGLKNVKLAYRIIFRCLTLLWLSESWRYEMIISRESPLYRIPYWLNPREALFLDGIRFTVEMIDVAHSRLHYLLETIATDPSWLEKYPMAEPFLGAWSIVDSIYRLRSLVNQIPGIKQRDLPQRKIFLNKTKEVQGFRHTLQHLNNEIKLLADQGRPTWGTLYWFTLTEFYEEEGSIQNSPQNVKAGCWCLLISGSVVDATDKKFSAGPVSFLDQVFEHKVNLITLNSGTSSISISDHFNYVEVFAHALETYMVEHMTDLPEARSDLQVKGRVTFPEASYL